MRNVVDDDGVTVVARTAVAATLTAARARSEQEDATRARLRRGELGLDIYGLRQNLADQRVEYLDYQSYHEPPHEPG